MSACAAATSAASTVGAVRRGSGRTQGTSFFDAFGPSSAIRDSS